MNSTLFLNNIATIDHSIIDYDGRVVGGSVHLSCLVTCEASDETVKVDLGGMQKSIKDLICDSNTGYDHKLWVVGGVSSIESFERDDRVKIETSTCKFDLPHDSVRVIGDDVVTPTTPTAVNDIYELVSMSIGDYLEDELNDLCEYEGVNIIIECFLNTFPVTLKAENDWYQVISFRYCHGASSGDYGQQNIAHGHLSFVEMLDENYEPVFIQSINDKFQDNYYIFINENDVARHDGEWVKVQYETPHDLFCAEYKEDEYEIVYLSSDATAENMIEWFVAHHGGEMAEGGVKHVFMSEGLTKGAMLTHR